MAQLAFQRARTEENKRQRAAALVEAARSLALETGVASVTLTAVASRAGIHYSAVRRYFTSHKEVLLHLAAEGWQRWSTKVCEELGQPGPMTPARVAETLANGLAADPLFCDLLANLHLHLEHEVDIERVVEIRRTIAAAVFVGLSVHDAQNAELDFRCLDSLLIQELQDGFLVGFGLGVEQGKVVTRFLVAQGPYCEIGFHCAFDEAFYGYVAIAQARGFDLGAKHPTADDQA